MKKALKIILKILLYALITIVAYFAFVLIYGSFTDYQPAFKKEADIVKDSVPDYPLGDEFTFLSWNIGYGGLGYKEDFFYDGGKKTRAKNEDFEVYINGIYAFLDKKRGIDFILLQEMDISSTRSYKTNQLDLISHSLSEYNYAFAYNYKVDYVPIPLFNPMRKVESGIALFSKYKMDSILQISFPANYSWPTKIFMLDRCFIYSSYPLENGKSLIVINTHNSAFDDGELRDVQMTILKSFMLDEYAKGNYVVAGGDWNLNPPEFNPETYIVKYKGATYGKALEKDFFPEDWSVATDKLFPSNRSLTAEYKPGVTETTTLDYFICSPNIKVKFSKTFDERFLYSDHNPVFMQIKLMDFYPDSLAVDSLIVK